MDATKLVKSLSTKSYILIPHIDKYQAKGQFPKHWDIRIDNYKSSDEYFHPSSDCLLTEEELILYKTGQKEPEAISPLLRRAFDCGTMWHGYYENILVDMGFVSQENVERYHVAKIETSSGEIGVAGTGDLVNVAIPGHGDWLVDLKTMNDRSFNNPPKALMEKYRAQVNIYSDFFGLDKIMILAIKKDSPHELKEIIIQKDQELITSIYEKWGRVKLAIDQQK